MCNFYQDQWQRRIVWLIREENKARGMQLTKNECQLVFVAIEFFEPDILSTDYSNKNALK